MKERFGLVADVLDKQLLGRNRELLGRVDGFVAVLSADGRPEVTHLTSGWGVLWRRVRPGRVTRREHRLHVSLVRELDLDVHLELMSPEAPTWGVERRLRDVLRRIPGGE